MTGRLLLAVGFAVTTALALAWGSGGPARATTFNPFYGPPDFYRLDPTTPGSNPDVHAQFNILPPSANVSPHFGGQIGLDDADVSIASAGDIPGTGAFMGHVDSMATFGIANEGCNTQTSITFNLI